MTEKWEQNSKRKDTQSKLRVYLRPGLVWLLFVTYNYV